MSVLKVENLSKQYRLGTVGTGTISHDLNRWWHLARGKEDPYLKIGETNQRDKAGGEYVWALKDINFEVEQGEILGIIGKNGAGKSTLLKILSKVTGPTTGRIRAKGRIASLLEVGTGFHPELTGRENIYLNGAILGMTRTEITSKLEEIVEFAGVAKYIDTPVKRYSSGMTVRLGFAVAAHLEPEILIVDEVLAVGDAEFQKKAIGKMQDVSKGEGRTVLFVSHNMATVQNLCNKAIVLEDGKIAHTNNQQNAITYYLSNSSPSSISIKHRVDRKGNQDIVIEKIEIIDQNDNILTDVYSGQNILIRIFCRVNNKSNIQNIRAIPGIAIKDEMGNPLFLHHSRMCGLFFTEIHNDGFFTITINKIPLLPGKYRANCSIISTNGYIDGLEDAFSINVINGNFNNYVEIPPSSHGKFLIDANWSYEKSSK